MHTHVLIKLLHLNLGSVTFTDITEDQYTLHAQAENHTSYSAVIIASPDETSIRVFLQRVSVTYTWTVTPTDVQDTYIITLDSTFETFVSNTSSTFYAHVSSAICTICNSSTYKCVLT